MITEAVLDSFLNHYSSNATKESYSISINSFLDYINYDPSSLTRKDVKGWLGHLSSVGNGPATIRLRLAALKTFMSYLVEEGLIKHNPTKSLKVPKAKRPLPKPIQSETLFRLREGAKTNPKHRAIIELLYDTGVRVSELINIQTDNIYWDDNLIKITHGKGNKQRFVIFTTHCHEWLKRYLSTRHDECPFLFVNQHNRPLTRQGIVSILKKCHENSQTHERIGPHKFRHKFATRMLEKGAPLDCVAQLMGHADYQTTRLYAEDNEKIQKGLYDEFM